MKYCKECGNTLNDNAKYCDFCGAPVVKENTKKQRKQVFEGKIVKCPNCGEALKSFELNCPACGYEFRGIRTSDAIKEFSLKLETLEARREYEKSHGLFAAIEAQQRISKTDEQKISLIKSFSVPNSREDMLEFMILATSNINMNAYDSANTNLSKGEKEINAAWCSKVQQVYEKAKRSYSTDNVFSEIKALYDECNERIKKNKKKGIIKWVLMVGWIPLILIVIIAFCIISEPKEEAKEIERLDNIVLEVQQALEDGEFSHALRIADSIDYQRYDVEMEREWDIQREYWVEKVINEAKVNGVELEYTMIPDVDNANDKLTEREDSNKNFGEGLKKGVEPVVESINENFDEFEKNLNE